MKEKQAILGTVLSFPQGASKEASASKKVTGGAPVKEFSAVPSGQEGPMETQGVPDQYGEVFSRLNDKVREGDRSASVERESAPFSLARLVVMPHGDRLAAIREDESFKSYLLAEMFLERSRQCWHDDIKAARESAEVALAIAESLDGSLYGRSLRLGLELRCKAFLAHSLHIGGDLVNASQRFSSLVEMLPEIFLEPYERAEILGLWSAVLREKCEFEQAQSVLSEVHDIYLREGDEQKVGRTLIHLGLVFSEMGNYPEATQYFEQSLEILDEDRSRQHINVALLNLAVSLNGAGENDRALATIHETRTRLESSGDRIFKARLRWIEARVLGSLKRAEEAESAFLEVLKFFSDRDVDIDAALVCMDLAVLYIEQHRTDSVKALAQRMLPVFSSQGFGREVMAALILFQHAAERELATLGLVQEISKYVQRAFRVPGSTTGEL